MAEEPEVHACDGDDAIDEGRGEDSDTNDLVPFRVKIDKVTIKEDVFKAKLLKSPFDKALLEPHVDDEEDDSSINELNDPHFGES